MGGGSLQKLSPLASTRGPGSLGILVLSLFLPSCTSNEQFGEGVVIIPGEPSCESCRIELDHVVRLGDEPDGYLLGNLMRISKDSRDRWYVFGPSQPASAKVFGSDGRFLGDFGIEGGGPGEFKGVVEVLEYPPGTLNFWDPGNNRFSRFTLDLAFIDQFTPEIRPYYHAFTTNGLLAVNGTRIGEDGKLQPLHFLTSDGHLLRSFGRAEKPYENGPPAAENIHPMSPGSEDGIWVATNARYEIERWDSVGTSSLVLTREVPWFPPHSDPAIRVDPRGPAPRPRLRSIREDSNGRLWTLSYLPTETWRDGFHLDTLSGGMVAVVPVEEEQYETRIEVLDPRRGIAIAGLTIPERMDRFVAAPFGEVYLYSYSESPTGEPYLEIWKPVLLGQNAK